MTNSENPSEMGSASSGSEGSEHSFPSSFPSFSLEDKSRRLFFQVAQLRRVLSPVFKIVVAKIDTLLGPQAARMLALEGGPLLASHVLIRPWTQSVDFPTVERVALEVELSFRELGYQDLITNVERKWVPPEDYDEIRIRVNHPEQGRLIMHQLCELAVISSFYVKFADLPWTTIRS